MKLEKKDAHKKGGLYITAIFSLNSKEKMFPVVNIGQFRRSVIK